MDIRKFLVEYLQFTDENLINTVLACADVKAYPRGQVLMYAGDPNNYIGFLVNGLCGGYANVGETEKCECFVYHAGHTLIDSFPVNQTSRITIKAIEDSNVLRIPVSKVPELLVFRECVDLVYRQNAFFMAFHTEMQHINGTYDADNRITQFALAFPELIGRVPDHELASILGISERTLFRARRRLREGD